MALIKTSLKVNELTEVLQHRFPEKINRARLTFIAHFLIALCKVQTVTFEKLAHAFESSANPKSSHRRIQRFIASYTFNPDWVAQLIFNLLPTREKLTLCIDRTNWKFGQQNINIFMLGITYEGVAFPLLFSMLDKQGNSNSSERIALLNRFICLFGKDCIDALVADREFVGEQWINFLNTENIPYYIRIRNNFKVYLPDKNKTVKAFWLFNTLPVGHYYSRLKIVSLHGNLCYISGKKLTKGEFLILIAFNKADHANAYYKERWQIETCFKAMKSSGFDIESTHLQKLERIQKLVLLVMIAFLWCYKVGIYRHQATPISTKKHGRKAKSIFKYGLDYIHQVLINPHKEDNIQIFSFLSCT